LTSTAQLKREVAELKNRLPKPEVQYIIEVVGTDGHVYDTWIIPTGQATLKPKYQQLEDTEL
jgi:hypothetical protein